MLTGTAHALWLCYQQLNPDIRRCIEYCSIFPKGFKLIKNELFPLWIAQGFVRISCATEDMEDVAEGYVQELVSYSFLQPEGTSSDTNCFTIHDVLHDMFDKISGNFFRIENARSEREGWKGDVPRDVHHLFVQKYDEELIGEKILGLDNLLTLIVYVVETDVLIEEKVIESICKRLRKLRVLAIAFSKEHRAIMQPDEFSIPKSICQLKHLCYFAFRTKASCTLILPRSLNKLHHVQLLDFGDCDNVEFTFGELVNLRHIFYGFNVKFPNISRLISLQTVPSFTVRNEPGYEIEQLRDLNSLRRSLVISGLANVKSKEEALEANLAGKERLRDLAMLWGDSETRCSPEVEAEILEGMCPPVGLQELQLDGYKGSRYPDWMVGKQDGGPKYVQSLCFQHSSRPGPASELAKAFPHLRVLKLWWCSWDALPGSMEYLTSLKELGIHRCLNIRSLPTLPQSLEDFVLSRCDDKFMKSCQTFRHPNWQKIEHIPRKRFQ
ncbi:putative disease resistance RPP13-like protein 1 [Lolium perenne]|uniref:putative disease resistance RPP13-like protein 1 n=1 Tax=Lolium perenne TaxID=4522 RepID=UPI003A9A5B45